MSQEVTIKESHYYTYQDEKHFFDWLDSTPGIGKVTGGPKGLTIEIRDPGLGIDDWADFTALLVRYGIDLKPLRALVNSSNESWIRDPKRFWYEGIFE
jgi:hypothetical protein